MTRTYQNELLSFAYPETWTISDESGAADEGFQLSLEEPAGALWMVCACTTDTAARQTIAGIKSAIAEQFENVEWSPTTVQIDQETLRGSAGHFFSLDLLVAAQILRFERAPYWFVVLSQAESCDYERLREVFRAITTSLLRSQHPAGNPG